MAAGCSGKTELSLVEVLVKLAELHNESESLSQLIEGDVELVGDFEDEDNGIGFLNPVGTHNATSVNAVFQTNILSDELDGEAVSEIMPMFSLYITV